MLGALIKNIGRLILLITILASPLYYGGKYNSTQVWLYYGVMTSCAASLITLLLTPKVEYKKRRPLFFWVSTIPLLLALGVGGIQLCSFSDTTLRWLSPHILELRDMLAVADDSPVADFEKAVITAEEKARVPEWSHTVSVCPQDTRDFLATLILVVATFVAAGVLFDTTAAQWGLLKTVALYGWGMAIFCMITQANPDWEFYKKYLPEAFYGPYINKNNAACFLCLCLGPAFALFIENVLKTVRVIRKEHQLIDEENDKRFRPSKIQQIWFDIIDSLNRGVVFWGIVNGIILASIMVSLSRGGAIAAMTAVLLSFIFLMCRRGLRKLWYLFGILGLFCVIWISWSGFQDRVEQRMSTITTLDGEENAISQETRFTNWLNAFQTAREYYYRGAGLGTYYLANRNNDIALHNRSLFYFAENILVQTLVEAGWMGIFLILSELCCVGVAIGSSCSSSRSDRSFACGVGMFVSLTAVTVSNMMDFGLYNPSIALSFALIFGAYMNRSNHQFWDKVAYTISHKKMDRVLINKSKKVERAAQLGTGLIFLTLVFCLVSGYWGIQVKKSAAVMENLLKEEKYVFKAPNLYDIEQISAAIKKINEALEQRPGDIKAYLTLGNLWNRLFQLNVWKFLCDRDPLKQPLHLWIETFPERFHQTIVFYLKYEMTTPIRMMQEDPLVAQYLPKATKVYMLAQRICPIFPEPYCCMSVYLPMVYSTTWEKQKEILEKNAERACLVSSNETQIYYHAGAFLFLSEDYEQAFRYWRKSLELSPYFMSAMMDYLIPRVNEKNRDDFFRQIFPDDFDILYRGITKYPQKTYPVVYTGFLNRLNEVMENVVKNNPQDAVSLYKIACWQNARGEYQKAADSFEKAIQKDKIPEYYPVYALMLLDQNETLHRIERCVDILEYYLDCTGDRRQSIRNMYEKAVKLQEKERYREKVRSKSR